MGTVRSRAARLRAWAGLEKLRGILEGAGVELPKPAEKSFIREGEILERALAERDEALRELATSQTLSGRHRRHAPSFLPGLESIENDRFAREASYCFQYFRLTM